MRLSWNEIRARAAEFAKEWSDATYEKGETQSFYNEFFEVFGKRRRDVARYEEHVKKLDNRAGFIDLFWPGVLLVEQKSAGRNLDKAYDQAGEYFDALRDRDRPRYILVSDFQTFTLKDLSLREDASFPLSDLPKHIDKFGFILGVQKRTFKDQDPVNIEAAELVGALHDSLEESGFVGEDLERFLVRIVFCLFADDTGVFEPRDIFLDWLNERTSDDGSDLGPKLTLLFQTLDTHENKRGKHLDEDLARFPYVNGELFNGITRIPSFNPEMRDALLEACRFDWTSISPAIFGSLFQSVMDKKERRRQGAHYTTEKNILKVIGPLFLDGLWAEFDRAVAAKRGQARAFEILHNRIADMTFFDPACGCGNFLIISYRELRRLEIAILERTVKSGQLELDATRFSRVDVDQFFGIEIGEFAAEIARAAMWMMDHIMNNELSLAFGQSYARIPLQASPHIHCSDALELDWADVIEPENCSYILGNPPFSGFTLRDKEKAAQAMAMRKYGAQGGRLDYVAFWFFKAGEFLNRTEKSRPQVAFVATNSVSQGEQVEQLWPAMFQRHNVELTFAHRTFEWGSDARGKAHVHCVILGFCHKADAPSSKSLYSYPDIRSDAVHSEHTWLSPYLIDASNIDNRHLVVSRTRKPPSDIPIARVGTKPVDAGIYILTDAERLELLRRDSSLKKYVRPFVGATEFIDGTYRWLFCPSLMPPSMLANSKAATELVADVRKAREVGGNLSRQLANQPTQFHVTVIPDEPFLALPETTSSRREYVPFGWLNPPYVPSNKLNVVMLPEIWLFSILCSKMHISWLANIGGRLKNDFCYSTGIVYNTFPWPDLNDKAKKTLSDTGREILQARQEYPEASLAHLYDPNTMPSSLRKAHRANDKAVDRLYRRKAFNSDLERVEHLFMLYEEINLPLVKPAKSIRLQHSSKKKALSSPKSGV